MIFRANKKMNRTELITSMAELSGLKKTESEKALDGFIKTIMGTLAKGEEIRLIGFGTFKVVHRAESEGRNMKTKEPMVIPARNIAKFKPGKQLKEAVSGIATADDEDED